MSSKELCKTSSDPFFPEYPEVTQVEPPEYLCRIVRLAFVIKGAVFVAGREIDYEDTNAVARQLVETLDAAYSLRNFYPNRRVEELLEDRLVTYSQACPSSSGFCLMAEVNKESPERTQLQISLGTLREKRRHAVKLLITPVATFQLETDQLILPRQIKDKSERIISRETQVFLPNVMTFTAHQEAA